MLKAAPSIKQKKRRENLIEFADQARVSRDLVTLKQDVPVEVPLGEFGLAEPKASDLIGFLKAMEFSTLTKRVASELDADADAIEPIDVPITHWDAPAADETPSSDADAASSSSTPKDGATAYAAHPYRWPVLGWMADLDRISIDDCRDYFKSYYAPNNALIVLVRANLSSRWAIL